MIYTVSKKLIILLVWFIFVSLGYTFAITQTVNETNGVNYGYIKNIYKKWTSYYLSVDYIQIYNWYEAALARAEDGVIFNSLSTDYNQNYPKSYYTSNKDGGRFATKTIRKKINTYLTKIGSNGLEKILNKLDTYTWSNWYEVFNNLPEIERMIVGPIYDPATWWGNYIRNTNTKIRNIKFSTSAKIIVEDKNFSLDELVNWQKNPTQNLVKVFLKNSKIEWFRVEYHP